jgi:hypothetical protein
MMEPVTSGIVGEAVAGQAAQLRKRALKLIDLQETCQYDLGETLMEIQDKALYTQWGFNTYSEWIKTTVLKTSKSRYLPQIARVMAAIGVPREKYEPLGRAKLRVIASLNPTDVYVHPVSKEETSMHNFIAAITDNAITKGDEYPLKEIKKHVRTLKGITGDRDITFFGFPILRLALDNVVTPAIEHCQAIIGSVGKDDEGKSIDASVGTCIERICAEWMLTMPHDNAPEPSDIPEGTFDNIGEINGSNTDSVDGHLDGDDENVPLSDGV